MLDFDRYLMRHGEFGVQAIIEGVRHNRIIPLEDRWAALMAIPMAQPQSLAA